MASFTAVRDGLMTRLETITGLRAHDTVPATINPPAAVVTPGRDAFIVFDTTQSRGSDDLHWMVLLLVSAASDRAGQDNLDGYLAGSGALSVKDALEGDQTLGGVAHYVAVTEARRYGTVDYGGVGYLSCEFAVVVGV